MQADGDTDTEGPRISGTKTRVMPEGKRFQPGNPGRPKVARNKLGEDFVQALYADFKEQWKSSIW